MHQNIIVFLPLQNVVTSNEDLNKEWVMFTMHWFYDKDFLTEDVILDWFSRVDRDSSFYDKAILFTNWLQEAEEASSESD